MREIEYKAKMVDGDVWVYGFLSDIDEITVPNEDDSVGYYTMDAYNVIPETVCQWTTLNDKNGKRLYKGDIFVYQKHDGYLIDNFIGAVNFKDGCYGYSVYFKYAKDAKTFTPFSKFDELQEDFLNHIEVIGNINDKERQKQALIDTMRGDEELGLYDCGNEQ